VVALVVALVVAVVLAGGLVVADRVARSAAQERLGRQAQAELSLPEPAQVSIGGASFLWQALRGRYERVDVAAPSLTWEGTTVRGVSLQVRDVTVPRSVLRGAGGEVRVARGSARALLPWSLLADRASAATGTDLALDAGPDGTVRATTEVRLLGRDMEVSLRSTPELEDGEVLLRPVAVAVGGRELTVDSARRPLEALGLERVLRAVPLPLEDVPDGVTPTRLRVVDGGIVVDAALAAQVLAVPPR